MSRKAARMRFLRQGGCQLVLRRATPSFDAAGAAPSDYAQLVSRRCCLSWERLLQVIFCAATAAAGHIPSVEIRYHFQSRCRGR